MTSPRPPRWPTLARRRAYSDRLYTADPARFAGEPSRFVAWVLDRIPRDPKGLEVLELGCGVGRDSRALAAAGCRVRAVDHSAVALARARLRRVEDGPVEFIESELLSELGRTGATSQDLVYAHGVYMAFSEPELDRLVREVRRVLRPGGLHAFAVRSTADPRFGKGREVAPDVFLGGPHELPMHYFRRQSLDRLTRPDFERLATRHRTDLALWYVLDRRR